MVMVMQHNNRFGNLVPSVSLLPVPRRDKKRDPGNQVVDWVEQQLLRCSLIKTKMVNGRRIMGAQGANCQSHKVSQVRHHTHRRGTRAQALHEPRSSKLSGSDYSFCLLSLVDPMNNISATCVSADL